MLISIPWLIVLILSAFVSSIIAGMMGMAGGILFVGVLASIVDTVYVVPVHAVVMAISSGARALLFIKHINWRIFGWYILGMLPGALVGIYIFRLLPKDLIKLMMGIFLLAAVFVPTGKKEILLSERIFIFAGALAGLFGIFFGASGALTSPFFIRRGIIKEALISTKAACQIVTHLIKIPLFGFIGVNVFVYWKILIFLCLAVIPGVYVGKRLLNRMSDRTFLLAFKAILIVIAGRLIVEQLIELLCR